jgi:hypothetical protein
MRSLATTRDGTAAFVSLRLLLHWQLSAGQPQPEQTRPRSVE